MSVLAIESGAVQSAQHDTTFGPITLKLTTNGVTPIAGALVDAIGPNNPPNCTWSGQVSFVGHTDNNGIVVIPGGLNSTTLGQFQIEIFAFDSNTALATITSTADPVPPTDTRKIEIVSGNYQKASPNATFAAGLAVRCLNEAGNPLAGESVQFNLSTINTVANGKFPGNLSSASANTNAQGVATSPLITANAIGGSFNCSADWNTSPAASPSVVQFQLTITAAPTVTLVTPASGSTAGGQTVQITGTGFTSTSAVSFGGVPALGFSVINDTHINATTPAHAGGAVSVLVTTPQGTNAANSLYTFTAPVVASASNPLLFCEA